MNNLRDLTHENHKRVERTRFAHRLLKKQITPEQYYTYLSNQLMAYYALEYAASIKGIFKDIEEVCRSNRISQDMDELESEYGFDPVDTIPHILPSTTKYIQHIQSISSDAESLMAHVYVRHMGDLSGGQIIKRFIPGSGLHYCFDGDIDVLKGKIRAKLHDGMAVEANACFDMIFEFFEELENSFADMGSANITAE